MYTSASNYDFNGLIKYPQSFIIVSALAINRINGGEMQFIQLNTPHTRLA